MSSVDKKKRKQNQIRKERSAEAEESKTWTPYNSVYLVTALPEPPPISLARHQIYANVVAEIARSSATTAAPTVAVVTRRFATSHNSAYANMPFTPQGGAQGTSHQPRPLAEILLLTSKYF